MNPKELQKTQDKETISPGRRRESIPKPPRCLLFSLGPKGSVVPVLPRVSRCGLPSGASTRWAARAADLQSLSVSAPVSPVISLVTLYRIKLFSDDPRLWLPLHLPTRLPLSAEGQRRDPAPRLQAPHLHRARPPTGPGLGGQLQQEGRAVWAWGQQIRMAGSGRAPGGFWLEVTVQPPVSVCTPGLVPSWPLGTCGLALPELPPGALQAGSAHSAGTVPDT